MVCVSFSSALVMYQKTLTSLRRTPDTCRHGICTAQKQTSLYHGDVAASLVAVLINLARGWISLQYKACPRAQCVANLDVQIAITCSLCHAPAAGAVFHELYHKRQCGALRAKNPLSNARLACRIQSSLMENSLQACGVPVQHKHYKEQHVSHASFVTEWEPLSESKPQERDVGGTDVLQSKEAAGKFDSVADLPIFARDAVTAIKERGP